MFREAERRNLFIYLLPFLVSARGEEGRGPLLTPKCPYLELSLSSLDICTSGGASANKSTSRVASSIEQASCSIFTYEDEDFY